MERGRLCERGGGGGGCSIQQRCLRSGPPRLGATRPAIESFGSSAGGVPTVCKAGGCLSTSSGPSGWACPQKPAPAPVPSAPGLWGGERCGLWCMAGALPVDGGRASAGPDGCTARSAERQIHRPAGTGLWPSIRRGRLQTGNRRGRRGAHHPLWVWVWVGVCLNRQLSVCSAGRGLGDWPRPFALLFLFPAPSAPVRPSVGWEARAGAGP